MGRSLRPRRGGADDETGPQMEGKAGKKRKSESQSDPPATPKSKKKKDQCNLTPSGNKTPRPGRVGRTPKVITCQVK
jgi:hypothetical protein